jgi:hypothetical protein
MATVNLHLTGVSLRRESLRSHGAAAARHWLPLALVLSAVGVLAGSIAWSWSSWSEVSTADEFSAAVRDVAGRWPVHVVLWPFASLMRLPLSATTPEFLAALPVGLAALAVNYVWVLRSDVAFEEAAARDAEQQVLRRRAARYTPNRARRRPPPFRLRPTGRAEIALLWKNLILASRVARWGVFWRLLPLVILGAFTVSQTARTVADALATICALGAAAVTLIGPQVVRNDLRQDLAQMATFKLWPVSGGTIVRGAVLAPTVLLSAIVWILLTAALLLSARVTFDMHLAMAERAAWTIAAMVVATGIILVEIVVQNALAVLFPAWMDLGATSSRGMEVMGQRLLAAGGIIVAVGLSILPAIVVAALVSAATHAFAGIDSVVVSATAAALTLLLESALVVTVLGRVVDRTDAGAVPPGD